MISITVDPRRLLLFFLKQHKIVRLLHGLQSFRVIITINPCLLFYYYKTDELLGEAEAKDIPSPWKGAISYKIEGTGEEVKEKIESPSAVGPAVEAATGKLTKGAKEISDSLIHLEVQSQTVPDLTLIDLPGIARVPVEGQRGDVPEQIKSLIKKYVQKEETIILAVIPCNVDIATTEALQLAQQVCMINLSRRHKTCIILLWLTPDYVALANIRRFYSSEGRLPPGKS